MEDQNSGHELASISNVEESLGLCALDLQKGLNSETADEHNYNEFQTRLISFAGPEVPSQESPVVENGLNMDPFKEGSNGFSHESGPQCADEHTPRNSLRGSTAKPRETSKKAEDPGEVEKLRSDSIASRLRRRVRNSIA